MQTFTAEYRSPFDEMVVVWDKEGRILRLVFQNGRSRAECLEKLDPRPDRVDHVPDPLRSELDAYFAGDGDSFSSLDAAEGTPFHHQVWEAVRAIPYGQTASYGEIARRLGTPGASRAVRAANGANPVCLIVPCHRVIGADGSLTGFGGGIETKRRLLALEMSRAPAGNGPQTRLPFG
jgi:methylated-DNA-[protein]-cysteine S-methyltransferase